MQVMPVIHSRYSQGPSGVDARVDAHRVDDVGRAEDRHPGGQPHPDRSAAHAPHGEQPGDHRDEEQIRDRVRATDDARLRSRPERPEWRKLRPAASAAAAPAAPIAPSSHSALGKEPCRGAPTRPPRRRRTRRTRGMRCPRGPGRAGGPDTASTPSRSRCRPPGRASRVRARSPRPGAVRRKNAYPKQASVGTSIARFPMTRNTGC